MIYGLVEMFGNIVDTGSIYIICNALFERKAGTKFMYIAIAVLFQSLAMRWLNITIGNSHWIVLAALVLSSYLLCRHFFHLNGLRYLVSVFLFFMIVAAVEFLVTISITRIFNIENILLQSNEYRILGTLSSKIIILYILIYFLKMTGVRKFTMERYSILTLLIMMLSLSVFFMATGIYAKYPELEVPITYIMGIAVIMAGISILMLFIVRKIIEITKEKARFVAVEKEYKNQIEYLKKYEALSGELRSRRHEYKNHLINISKLANGEKGGSVAEYANNLLVEEQKTDNILKIENRIISALINYNIGKMEKSNIEFNYDIDLPKETQVSDIDMSIIMGNLLDNAIEACLSVEEGKRYIDLDITYGLGTIDINMKNSSDSTVEIANNHIKSKKKDKDNHGYGLNNIKNIVKKNKGNYKIHSNNNEFVAEITL